MVSPRKPKFKIKSLEDIVTPRVLTIAPFYGSLPSRNMLIDGTFEGGGTLGAAYCGCLMALARNGIWFQRVAGNSAGAITASIIAAGYDANEIDFLFTPLDAPKQPPGGLPANLKQNEINYAKFVDIPTSAADISLQTRRNHLFYHAVKGTVLDTLRNFRVNLPATAQMAETIVTKMLEKLPGRIGPFSWTVGGYDMEWNTGWRKPFDKVTVSVPGKTVTVGPFDLSLTDDQKSKIRQAVSDALSVYPSSLSLGDLGLPSTEAQRQQLADNVVVALLNSDPIYRLFLNFVGDGGLLKGDSFLATIRRLIEAKVGRSPVRFRDITSMDLIIIAADITDHRMMVYSQAQTPNMEVAEAVRRSMSIPFIYEPRMDGNHEVVDGGIVDNYPFWAHLINQNQADMQRIKIGFSLDSSKPAPTEWGCPDSSHKVLNIAATRGEDVISSILHSAGLDTQGNMDQQSLVEVKALARTVNVLATKNQKNILHQTLRELYQNRTDVKFYEVEVPLLGFFWLDFLIDRSTYNGMASRGWEAALQVLKDRALVPRLVSSDPYK